MTLFSIKNLVCSYDKKHPVLYITELDIPAGEICILFGKSGSGKSTLLETLGLMTNTIASSKEPFQTVLQHEPGIILNDDAIMSLKFYGRHDKENPEEITYIDKPYGGLPPVHENGFKVKFKHWRENINGWMTKENNGAVTDIWKNQNTQRQLQKRLRDEYFAFIFQNTNLMPNFSAEENAAIPEMIDLKAIPCGGKKEKCPFPDYNEDCEAKFTHKCAIVHARQTLVRDLDIPKNKLKEPSREFSGGQQQRITFARANNSHFSVLFGDEPTGNLDFYNSKELMKVIRKLIDNSHDDITRSAVIVSHSIDLTLQFANRIVFIETKQYIDPEDPEKKAIQYYGKIDSTMVYVSDSSTEDDGEREWRHVGFPDEILSNEQMDVILTKFLRK